MQTNIEKMRIETRWEARKFALQLVLGGFAALAAGAGAMLALLNFPGWRPH